MINWERVRELQDEVGAEDFDEVFDLFVSEVSGTIADLSSVDDGDRPDMFHALKGSAWSLGFSTFADLCQSGESAPASVAPEQIRAAFQESLTRFSVERSQNL